MAVQPIEDKARAMRRHIFEAKLDHPGKLYTANEYTELVGDFVISPEPDPLDPGPSEEEKAALVDFDLSRAACDSAGNAVSAAYRRVRDLALSADRTAKNEAEAAHGAAVKDMERAREELAGSAAKYSQLRRERTRKVAEAHRVANLPPAAQEDRTGFFKRLIGSGEKSALETIKNRVAGAVR